jgi:molybdenum-dependent DNA-binding transcriptional regulator ModE
VPPATPRTPDLASSLSARQDLAFIRQGGLAVGWSYRTCLNRLRRMGDCLGAPVVETAAAAMTGRRPD